MALSCIVSEIKRDIGRKSPFFEYRPAFDAPNRVGGGGLSQKIAITFDVEKLERLIYQTVK